jgi:hypothetical protein
VTAVDVGIVSEGRPSGKDQLCYKREMTSNKPRVEALDPPMVPFALGGMAAFVVAGLLVLAFGGPTGWVWICLAGFLLGFPGLITMLRHDAHRRRRRALSHPEFTVTQE